MVRKFLLKNRMVLLLMISMFSALLSGCDSTSDNVTSEVAKAKGEYTIYYPDDNYEKVYSYVYKSDTTDASTLVRELFDELEDGEYEGATQSVLPQDLGDISCNLDSRGLVTVYFSSAYQTLENTEEVLTRACVVKTLCQLDKVKCVQFYVNDKPLRLNNGVVIIESDDSALDSPDEKKEELSGEEVGIMTGYDFVNNIGSEENSVQKDIFTLYYASEDGKMLETSYLNVEYDATVSMEQLVVLQLINGPVSDGCYQSINSSTKINKITTKDSICYVDLSSDFLTYPNGVEKDVAVYSLVDSLVELSNVSKVQILIDGDVFTDYSEDGLIDRNFDLMDTKEE